MFVALMTVINQHRLVYVMKSPLMLKRPTTGSVEDAVGTAMTLSFLEVVFFIFMALMGVDRDCVRMTVEVGNTKWF